MEAGLIEVSVCTKFQVTIWKYDGFEDLESRKSF
jgi:hypothetical protein